jgi:two-component system, NarL family, nitrate/nitrite response regulator NarL
MRVTVVDDHALFAEALVIALEAQGVTACCVVPDDETTNLSQLGKEIASSRPDIVLLDLDLGVAEDTMRLLSALSGGNVTVIVVTGATDRVRCGEALAKGARAVIPKSASFSQIIEAVTRTRDGLPVMGRAERDALLVDYRRAADSRRELHAKFSLITRREAEVLGQLMVGKQVSEIARKSFVSESTVRTQVKAILAKLQVSSQLTAVALAHQLGWQPPSEERDDDTGSGGFTQRSGLSATG